MVKTLSIAELIGEGGVSSPNGIDRFVYFSFVWLESSAPVHWASQLGRFNCNRFARLPETDQIWLLQKGRRRSIPAPVFTHMPISTEWRSNYTTPYRSECQWDRFSSSNLLSVPPVHSYSLNCDLKQTLNPSRCTQVKGFTCDTEIPVGIGNGGMMRKFMRSDQAVYPV